MTVSSGTTAGQTNALPFDRKLLKCEDAKGRISAKERSLSCYAF